MSQQNNTEVPTQFPIIVRYWDNVSNTIIGHDPGQDAPVLEERFIIVNSLKELHGVAVRLLNERYLARYYIYLREVDMYEENLKELWERHVRDRAFVPPSFLEEMKVFARNLNLVTQPLPHEEIIEKYGELAYQLLCERATDGPPWERFEIITPQRFSI